MPRAYRRFLVIAAAVVAALALIWEGRIRPIAREIAARQAEITAPRKHTPAITAITRSIVRIGYGILYLSTSSRCLRFFLWNSL